MRPNAAVTVLKRRMSAPIPKNSHSNPMQLSGVIHSRRSSKLGFSETEFYRAAFGDVTLLATKQAFMFHLYSVRSLRSLMYCGQPDPVTIIKTQGSKVIRPSISQRIQGACHRPGNLQYVRVNHRRLKIAMPQQELNSPDIGP